MVEIVWQNGDLKDLVTRLYTYNADMQSKLVPIMEAGMLEGETVMRRVIVNAVTKTGQERAAGNNRNPARQGVGANGGQPGRVETGAMLDAVDSEVIAIDPSLVVGRIGWTAGALDYFAYQENGTGTVPAMHALLEAFITAREGIRAAVAAIPWRP